MDTASPKPTLSQTIVRLRDDMGWTRETLAQRARVSVMTLHRYENNMVDPRTGKRNDPQASTLRKIAAALGNKDMNRAESARRQLFEAAGYGEGFAKDVDPETADLQTRVATLEQRVEDLRRMIESYNVEQRPLVLKLLEEFVSRTQAGDTPPRTERDG